MAELKESSSSRALGRVIAAGGEMARAVEATGIHRTQLWRYSTGRSKPDAEQVAKLHRATNGIVAADGWETDSAKGAA
jgi:DNA-binding phage protein